MLFYSFEVDKKSEWCRWEIYWSKFASHINYSTRIDRWQRRRKETHIKARSQIVSVEFHCGFILHIRSAKLLHSIRNIYAAKANILAFLLLSRALPSINAVNVRWSGTERKQTATPNWNKLKWTLSNVRAYARAFSVSIFFALLFVMTREERPTIARLVIYFFYKTKKKN